MIYVFVILLKFLIVNVKRNSQRLILPFYQSNQKSWQVHTSSWYKQHRIWHCSHAFLSIIWVSVFVFHFLIFLKRKPWMRGCVNLNLQTPINVTERCLQSLCVCMIKYIRKVNKRDTQWTSAHILSMNHGWMSGNGCYPRFRENQKINCSTKLGYQY